MKKDKIINHIENLLNAEIVDKNSISGGCIAQTNVISVSNGKSYFLKQGFSNSMFFKEANGLYELQKANTIKTPEVIAVNEDYLLLENISTGTKSHSFFSSFGEAFAKLHKYTSDTFGFYEDNFIGSTPQINTISNDWTDFYFTNRLLYQYKLAEKNGYVNSSFKNAFQNIEQNISSILNGSEEPPSLLHGDLWSGNYMVDIKGQAVIIDPAVYYGHREADLAMTKLFGGFTNKFYESYNNEYPLKDGYNYRENIYLLYHVLNHLNLFGTSYIMHALELINSYK